MFSLKSTKGCLSVVGCELLISIAIFSIFSVPFLISILYGFCIIFGLERTNLFLFSDDKTVFEFIESSFYALIKAIILIYAFSYFLATSIKIYIIILAFLAIDFIHFVFLYIFPENKRKLIFVGLNEQTKEIIDCISKQRFCCYKVEGILTTLTENKKEIYGIPVIGDISDIYKFADRADIMVICLRDWRGKINFYKMIKLKLKKIKFIREFIFYAKLKKIIPIYSFLRPTYFLFSQDDIDTIYLSVKSLIEKIIALVGLVFLSPVMLIITVLIKLDSPGPILYLQERVGLNGKVFRLIKFRSMIKDAEKYTGPVFAQENDPRITRVGKILRRFRLDELPQLINVLKGEMSLIGPRPERPYFVEKMREVIPYYDLRHTVKPGITGWAQVNYKYGDSIEDGKRKLEYDLYYIRHQSLLLDLLILLLTIRVAIFTKKY